MSVPWLDIQLCLTDTRQPLKEVLHAHEIRLETGSVTPDRTSRLLCIIDTKTIHSEVRDSARVQADTAEDNGSLFL